MRAGVRVLLEKHPDILVVGEADNGRDAVEMAARLHPDLVVMDVNMPELNGVDAATRIRHGAPHPRIVALSMRADSKSVVEMIRAGATGYVMKSAASEELEFALAAVLSGSTYLSPCVAALVVQTFVRPDAPPPDSERSPLSSREREVLQMISEGSSTKEIASALCVSVKTVESHRRQIMGKLGIHSIAGLTRYVLQEGLTSFELSSSHGPSRA